MSFRGGRGSIGFPVRRVECNPVAASVESVASGALDRHAIIRSVNRSLIAMLCIALLALASCASPEPPAPPPRIPQRIISVVPSATEMLYAFGLGDRVIAVGDYDQLPPGAENKPRIGGLLNPNVEKIIEYKPDLVITYGTQDNLRDRMKELGIRLY